MSQEPSNNSAPPIALLVCFALGALGLAVVMAQRRSNF